MGEVLVKGKSKPTVYRISSVKLWVVVPIINLSHQALCFRAHI